MTSPYVPCPACGRPKAFYSKTCRECWTATQPRAAPVYTPCPACGGPMSRGAQTCARCYDHKSAGLVSTLGDDRPFPMHGPEAQTYGAIISFISASGERLTLHRPGRIKEAVAEACRAAVAVDPTFRVTAVSTPTSIYTDTKGNRPRRGPKQGGGPITPEQIVVPRGMWAERAV